jgi:Uma2 family endonuclease
MGALKKEDYLPDYTYDDYKLWEGEWELISGIPYAMAPAPMIEHQSISSKISYQLHDQLKECTNCKVLLAVDWKIDDQTVVQPDNLVICHTPLNPAFIQKAPNLIFEILSESTKKRDRTVKYDLYEKEGVKYYVIVDPVDKIGKVYQLINGRYSCVLTTHDETIDFDLNECTIDFNFKAIF